MREESVKAFLSPPNKEIKMLLQKMMDVQETLNEVCDAGTGEDGASEAAVALLADAVQLVEVVNTPDGDERAIEAFMKLLEYFVVRGYNAEELALGFAKRVDEITNARVAAFNDEMLLGIIERVLVLAEIDRMNALNDLELK